MFERFTDRARRVVVLAQEEARLLDHNYIGTEHLLLGLVHEGEGVAGQALGSLGISLEAVRRQVEEIIGRGDATPPAHIPFTPRAKKVLELSLREAMRLRHDYIGTEHILLGLVAEGEGVAAQVLVARGADLPRVRTRVVELLSSGAADRRAAAITLSAELQAVLGEAGRHAAAAGASEVAPIHLFLAAVDDPDGAAGRMLRVVGVDPGEPRRQLVDETNDEPRGESGDPPRDEPA